MHCIHLKVKLQLALGLFSLKQSVNECYLNFKQVILPVLGEMTHIYQDFKYLTFRLSGLMCVSWCIWEESVSGGVPGLKLSRL